MLVKRMFPKQRTSANILSIRDFYHKRNKVLIIRNARGLGDILMCRMMFEDFKRVMPDMHLVFACPTIYHDLVRNHPFVDEVVDSVTVNRSNYLISYDISTCCIKWECDNAPFANKHRADIWAEHCGVTLSNHNMHLPILDKELLQFGQFQVKQARNMSIRKFDIKSPNVLFTPIAFDVLRTLTDRHIIGVIKWLHNNGCFVYSTHMHKISLLEDLGVPVLSGFNTLEWLSLVNAADYVVTVDTSVFHYAGGIGKPMTGIFTHADGKYRGKYFDFVLVQKHRDNGNWPCGPCYNHAMCTHPKCLNPGAINVEKPCLTELTITEITDGIKKMFDRWPK